MDFGLESYTAYVEYLSFIVVLLLAVFWRPIVGIYYLLPLIPLQTLRYRINEFPLGQSIVGIMLLGVAVGLLRRQQLSLPKTPWTKLLCAYAIFTFASLCLGSLYLGGPFPMPGDVRFGVWQEYMTMPALLLLVAAVSPSLRQMKVMVLLMCLTILLVDHSSWNSVSGHDFSTYSDSLRDVGALGYAGSNGLAAFGAQAGTFLLALAALESRWWLRTWYFALGAFSALCVMYALSRGGYLAFLSGCLFLGFAKQRTLLILLVIFLCTWTSLVPQAVQQRVMMTYDSQSGSLDHSAETRIVLWEDAMQVFQTNPIVGTGFDTYEYMHRVGNYEDTHNMFLKVLLETGVVGSIIFLCLLQKTFCTGLWLFRRAKDRFLASLGLGLAGWMVCSAVANCFGDRWSYFQINGYMWVLGGLVARGCALLEEDEVAATEGHGIAEPIQVRLQ